MREKRESERCREKKDEWDTVNISYLPEKEEKQGGRQQRRSKNKCLPVCFCC